MGVESLKEELKKVTAEVRRLKKDIPPASASASLADAVQRNRRAQSLKALEGRAKVLRSVIRAAARSAAECGEHSQGSEDIVMSRLVNGA